MTHLGQRLSALIDGELESSERERALVHVTGCGSCRDELAALWALKRKLHALNETAAGAGLGGLTGRLLNELLGLNDSTWPPPPGGWPARGHPPEEATPRDRNGHPDQRGGRLFLAGSVAIFLAGLGTAAVLAGGEPQARAPAPPVAPSIDVLVAPHNYVNQGPTGGSGSDLLMRRSSSQWSHPDVNSTYLPGQP